jgi:hypothetical protein
MSGIILTLPIVAGKVEAWRRFCQEISGSRRSEHEASRLSQGITRERLALIETAYGSTAVTTFEADNVNIALNALLTSLLPFDRWYREQVELLHGITLDGYEQFSRQDPLPDNQELLYEWVPPTSNNNGHG